MIHYNVCGMAVPSGKVTNAMGIEINQQEETHLNRQVMTRQFHPSYGSNDPFGLIWLMQS